ncbi:MAG TPA: amidase, partial [Alteromonas sp.]|nr:amidase [Alteromonas sp.]
LTKVKDLPVGLSVIGGQWQDAQVLNTGLAFERANQFIATPAFLPNRLQAESVNGIQSPYQKPAQ